MKSALDLATKMFAIFGLLVFVAILACCVYLVFPWPPTDQELRTRMTNGSAEPLEISGTLLTSKRAWLKRDGNAMGEPGGMCGLYRVSDDELKRLKSIGKIIQPEHDEQCWGIGPSGPGGRICPKMEEPVKVIAYSCQGPSSHTYLVNEARREVMFVSEGYD